MLAHIINHFVEVALVVVDDGPPTAPSGHAVDLAERSSAHYWHSRGNVTHRNEWTLLIIAESVVNLVRDNWDLVLVGDGQDLEHVFLGEAGTAGVRRVVHKDSASVRLNLRLHVLQVDVPVVFWLQSVSVKFNT